MQIYKITNKITGKCYIGQTKDYKKRFQKHIINANNKINRRLYDSMNYHGIEHFEISLIEDLGNVSLKESNDRETYWIKKLNTLMPNGYNMTEGGGGGYVIKHWPLKKKKKLWKQQSETRTGHKVSKETRDKISKANKGKKLTEERRKQISITNKKFGIAPPKEYWGKKGDPGFFKGKKHKQSSKNKMSKARSGKTWEEILGKENAAQLRKSREGSFSGPKNPKYIDFNNDHKILIKKILSKKKENMNILCVATKMSPYKIRQWFRELGIDNYQRFMFQKTDKEWKSFWRSINVNRNI